MHVTKTLAHVPAIKLADYILKTHGPMSHLKLQKLLYYCEGYHLAYFSGNPVIEENFEAWVHGPVCREVFNNLRDKSILYSEISFEGKEDPKEYLTKTLTLTQIEVISSVLGTLASWKDIELEEATHREAPWRNARKGYSAAQPCSEIISKKDMEVYYREELAAE